MDIYKPIRVILLIYELFRLIFLAFSMIFFSSLQDVVTGGIFPYLVFISSNALFPLICFFLFLQPIENRNYLPLYMAGKTIAVVLFFTWIIFNNPLETGFLGWENYMERIIILGGTFLTSLGDTLTVLGSWILNRKLIQTENLKTETGGGM